MREPLL